MLRLFQRQAPEQAAHIEVAHDGEIYRVALKRVATSRRFTLRVRTATRDALLTMPSRSSLKAAREFAERHAAWIGTRLARLPEPVAFEPRAVTPLRGVDHRIVHRPGERGVVWLEASERGPLICVSGERPHVARRVTDFLKREARKDLEAAVARHSKQLGVKPRRIVLRDTVSRWGSCSSTGGLEFFLAPDSRAAVRARLSRRARGRAYRAHESFGPVLEARAAPASRHRPRRGLAQGPWRQPAPLRRDVGVRSLSRFAEKRR